MSCTSQLVRTEEDLKRMVTSKNHLLLLLLFTLLIYPFIFSPEQQGLIVGLPHDIREIAFIGVYCSFGAELCVSSTPKDAHSANCQGNKLGTGADW